MAAAEPNWGEVRDRMLALTLRQLKPVKALFNGCLGGATTKGAIVGEMVGQMQHWWHHCDWQGKSKVQHVMRELRRTEVA